MSPSKASQNKNPRQGESKKRSSLHLNGLQPPCEGSKLHPFSHRASAIRFIRLLSDPEREGHSQVFEVAIASKAYALKVTLGQFNFYDDEEAVEGLTDAEMDDFDLDTLHFHSDPFYSECRAYGKLIEKDLNGRVAVRCHGYTTVPAEKVRQLAERFHIEYWESGEQTHQPAGWQRQPYRAVVKDLIQNDVELSPRIARKMKKHLLTMRKHGIYPYDIKLENYRGGLLVDFSTAITKPHYWLHINKLRGQLEIYELADLINFDEMIMEANQKITVRTLPDQRTLAKLRPRDAVRSKYPK
ncbi:MAG: hypothetical protein Q9225_006325 [Loekoesia sp. 1 TL-2023]